MVQLIRDALQMAFTARRPADGVIFHCDRGLAAADPGDGGWPVETGRPPGGVLAQGTKRMSRRPRWWLRKR